VEPQPFTLEDRRRHERFTAPAITLAFDGERYTAKSWSLGGFMVDDYRGKLTPGALFVVDGICALDGTLEPVEIRSRVVRTDMRTGELMVSFLDLDGRAYAVLQDFMAERMRILREHQSV